MRKGIVIAGGGTGGHVFVADAVARALVDGGVEKRDLTFIGSSRGQERTLLAGSGIKLVLLPGRGIRRSFSPSAIASNIRALGGIAVAIVSAFVGLVRHRPAVVVSVGGYAAAPVDIAAVALRIPLVLVNVDAVPGMAHRVVGRFAAAACVAFDGTPLPRATTTGAPVREAFTEIEVDAAARRTARAALDVEVERPLVAVLTGSLGARSVNEAVLALASRWRQRSVTLYHVTGRRDFDDLSARNPIGPGDSLDYRQVPFEGEVPLLYQAADVAITRSGALTVAELAAAALPSVLVPLPGAPGDHQTLNARALVAPGGGVLLPDIELSAERLDEIIDSMLADQPALDEMRRSARSISHPDAAREVAEVVREHAR